MATPPRPDAAPALAAFAPYTRRLVLEPDHPLLRARGIRPESARRFEAGSWPHAGFLEGCVGVRLHDVEGNPLGYAGRRVDSGEAARLGKWKLPPRLPKSELLFGYHRARPHLGLGVIVVEGPFDAMRVWQAGHPNVVALLGTELSPVQRELLAALPRIVVMLDGDDAGRAGACRLALALAPTHVDIVELSEGADPAEIDDDELRRLLRPFLSQPVPERSRAQARPGAEEAVDDRTDEQGEGWARPAKVVVADRQK